ncbi:MAG: sugar nucleotide-binding protein [Magnetovibrio sp.]|nr:sugar nucleotide-binding protein [Magnetovibrio sp.]
MTNTGQLTGLNGPKRIIIIGASGMIGSRLCALASDQDIPLIATCRSHPVEGCRLFDMAYDHLVQLAPTLGAGDVVYLLAANSDPNAVFREPDAARLLNVNATLRLAREAMAVGARVVFVSTEQVFDGAGGFCEDDMPKPQCLYAQQKVEVEQTLLAEHGDICIVRAGALVGDLPSDNCIVAKTYETLLKPEACMARDNVFTVTDVHDIANVLLLLSNPSQHRLYHVAAGPEVSRTVLADLVMEMSRYGSDMTYKTVNFADIPYAEPRGCVTWMKSKRIQDEFGYSFTPTPQVVRQKVQLLDDWRKAS